MSRRKRLLLGALAAAAILGVAAAMIAPALLASNCGGNSAALHDVREYALIVEAIRADHPGRRIDLGDASPDQRAALARIAGDFWIRPARFLVAVRSDRAGPSGPRGVLIVCDRPFRNVPRRILGSAPTTHAAAFADGSCGLISVAEFRALDPASLIPLDELLAESGPGAARRPEGD